MARECFIPRRQSFQQAASIAKVFCSVKWKFMMIRRREWNNVVLRLRHVINFTTQKYSLKPMSFVNYWTFKLFPILHNTLVNILVWQFCTNFSLLFSCLSKLIIQSLKTVQKFFIMTMLSCIKSYLQHLLVTWDLKKSFWI